MKAIGRVVGTERKPNTPHEFHFWTAPDSDVGIGTLVKVVIDAPRALTVYGIVVDGASYTDLQTALHDYIGLQADPAPTAPAATERPEIRVYTAAVLRHEPPEPLQPVPSGSVFLASDEDVRIALRMDAYAKPGGTGIPAGLYITGGQKAPIYLDADFLLGPEAAHLNITGVSGLATKTSAVLFLLASIFEHLSAEKGSVAALCFNVKGPDLLFLDQNAELGEEDTEIYETLQVPPRAFEKVHYYAPFKPDGYNLNTLRTHEELSDNVQPLVWGLEQILKFAEVLLTREDVDAKADALIEFIRERVIGREFGAEQGTLHRHVVRTFQELEAWFDDVLATCEQNNRESFRTHHVATIRKVRNRLLNLSTRAKGLVANDTSVSDLPWGEFEDRSVYVIDVANVEPEAQDLIFARVVTEARERLERNGLGVDHLVVFVDELNKYAPGDGHETYVRKMLLDVSERGRYLGLVLFSAQQFRSQVHKRVVGNAGTGIFGRMDMDELATPGYAVLSPATKSKLATLPKGELMIRHPHFTQPIFLRFPRPAVLAGRDGVRRFEPAADLPFEDAIARQVRRLDRSVPHNLIKDMIAGRDRDEVLHALSRTQQAQPENVLAFFRAHLKKQASREVFVEPARAVV
ncbi:MAG TPA: ATP-binding protein, partial [Longimicrobiales bacterium]